MKQMASDVALQIGFTPSTVHTISTTPSLPFRNPSNAVEGNDHRQEGKKGEHEVDIGQLMQTILHDWHHFMETAGNFREEHAELEGLRGVLERQQEAVKEVARRLKPILSSSLKGEGNVVEGGPSETENYHANGDSKDFTSLPTSGSHTPLSMHRARGQTSFSTELPQQQQIFILFRAIERASLAFGQRSQDHIRTMEQRLRQIALAASMTSANASSLTHNVPDENNMEVSEAKETQRGRGVPSFSPSWVAQSGFVLQRTQISATIALLHQHTSAVWRAVTQLVEMLNLRNGRASVAMPSSHRQTRVEVEESTRRSASSSLTVFHPATSTVFDEAFLSALQSCRVIVEEAEQVVLFPFHSLLTCKTNAGGNTTASAGGATVSVSSTSPAPPFRSSSLSLSPSLRVSTVNAEKPARVVHHPSVSLSLRGGSMYGIGVSTPLQ